MNKVSNAVVEHCREVGFKKGNIPWSKGLTKETDEKLKVLSEKIKEWHKVHGHPRGMLGKTAWNKGIDSRIKSICIICGE